MVGFTPQFKFREVYYSRGIQETSSLHRETFWAALDATSKMSRRFAMADGDAMMHTIEPGVIYEYVPATDQSQIAQIDQVDNLPKKSLLTYMARSRLLEQDGDNSFNWLDLTLAQSYHDRWRDGHKQGAGDRGGVDCWREDKTLKGLGV